jgi:type IV pilus assembly protein PilY1
VAATLPERLQARQLGVDDLWHAAVNGRGRFVNADSADELKLGMGQILQDIANNAGARAGAGFAATTLSATNHVVYRARFEPGWGGSLSKIEVDPKTGVLGTVDWEASTQLSTQLQVTVGSPRRGSPIVESSR